MNTLQTSWKSWTAIVVGFVAVTLGGFRNTAWSEDVAPPDNALSLEQRVNLLERKLEIADENSSGAAKTAAKPVAEKEGFSLRSADGNFILKFRALVQGDGRFFLDDQPGSEVDQFLLRRVRPIIEGTVWKDCDFRITPDFANNSSPSLYDAYLDVKTFPVKIRLGKFKPPVGLERLQSGGDLLFVERGFPTSLVPSRDTGVQLFGDLLGGRLSWAASLTNGVTDGGTGETDANDGKEGAVRLFATPFKEENGLFQNLGLGIAGTYAGSQPALSSYRTPGQLAAFAYGAGMSEEGERIRIVPQAYWYRGSFGTLAEYVRSSQDVRQAAVPQRNRLHHEAWQINASFVLTGEDASFKSVKPRKTFDPKNGDWGAWEVAGRYQRLDIDPHTFDLGLAAAHTAIQRATAWSAGINWYLNNAIKFVVDYEQTEFDKGAGTATRVLDRPTEKLVFTRWQISY